MSGPGWYSSSSEFNRSFEPVHFHPYPPEDARPSVYLDDCDALDGPDLDRRPELADVRRLARRGLRRILTVARADEVPSPGPILREHLGPNIRDAEVIAETWQSYEQVNVQRAVDAWLEHPGREHRLLGISAPHSAVDLASLLRQSSDDSFGYGAEIANVTRVNLPVGPHETLPCVTSAVYLVTDEMGACAVFVQVGEQGGGEVRVEIVSDTPGNAGDAAAELRRLSRELNAFRGHVLSFDVQMFGYHGQGLTFKDRPSLTRDHLVLESEVFASIEQQVVGIARHRETLLAAGQHLKRGILLYGPPGVGKTHTIRYLAATLPDVTMLLVSGAALMAIGLACSVARELQPAIVVVEDVDLIAEDRGTHPGQHPLLFTLLNEMDGVGGDDDIAFILTTNRPDLLEPALASRPGRVDQAIELRLPDLAARRALFELYKGRLVVATPTADVDDVLSQVDGVTASFIKELLRRTALVAAQRSEPSGDEWLTATGQDLRAAVDDLLSTRNRMTRALLGSLDEGPPLPD